MPVPTSSAFLLPPPHFVGVAWPHSGSKTEGRKEGVCVCVCVCVYVLVN